jgi:hypothetical protein
VEEIPLVVHIIALPFQAVCAVVLLCVFFALVLFARDAYREEFWPETKPIPGELE